MAMEAAPMLMVSPWPVKERPSILPLPSPLRYTTTEPPHSGPPPGIATSAPSKAPSWRGFLACSTSSEIRPCRSKEVLPLDGGAHQVAPLGPGPVVVAHLVVAE